MCSAQSPVTNTPTKPEPTCPGKTSTDREETGSDRAQRFAHSGMNRQPATPTTLPNLAGIDTLNDHRSPRRSNEN
jgi:hypothetical protein